jgi:hypothetical protein
MKYSAQFCRGATNATKPVLLRNRQRRRSIAYFSPSWTAFQADRGRDFSVIVDGISN